MKNQIARLAPLLAIVALFTVTGCNPDDFAVVKPAPEETTTSSAPADEPQSPAEGTKPAPAPEGAPTASEPAVAPQEPSGEDHPPTADSLASITIAPAQTMEGYDRDSFNWRDDVDDNGCDTRNDILARDLTDVVVADDDCKVLSGTLNKDPYNGETIDFTSDEYQSIDIDHIIPLGNAHISGASEWDEATKTKFANDPRNLVAVNASDNRSKSDKSAAEWLPEGDICWYAEVQVDVKAIYGLSMTQDEYDILSGILAEC